MKSLPVIAAALLCMISPAHAATSPSSIIAKVYEMRASEKSDCSNPVTVFKTVNPTPVDLMTSPTLGVGALPNGTYHCVMFHISDILRVVPAATEGSCVAGTAYDLDYFVDQFEDISYTPENVQIVAHPGTQDNPWIYFSDSSEADPINNCFEKNYNGCACSGPCTMTPLIELLDETHSLVININNKLDGSGPACALLQPVMSIR